MSVDVKSSLAELVLTRPSAARVLQRLGLEYCCGGRQSLREACADRGLDADTPAQLELLLHEHDGTGARLRRLRELGGDYATDGALCTTHRTLLQGLHSLELDLHQHVHEENNILFPRALAAVGGV